MEEIAMAKLSIDLDLDYLEEGQTVLKNIDFGKI